MEGKRIGRQGYWFWLLGLGVGTIVLGAVAIAAAIGGSFSLIAVFFLAMIGGGIWFRIVQMRRCRDAGWPAALPWIMFGLVMVTSVFSLMSLVSAAASGDLGALSSGGLSGLSAMASLADFGFTIALGFVPSKDAARGGHGGSGGVQLRYAGGYSPADEDAEGDDPIARALENYRRTGSAVPGSAPAQVAAARSPKPAPAPVSIPSGPPRPAGFGRRVV